MIVPELDGHQDATTTWAEGVNRLLSAVTITVGFPSFMTATTESVVPRSIPTGFATVKPLEEINANPIPIQPMSIDEQISKDASVRDSPRQ